MTKKELDRKMADLYWMSYWAGAGTIHTTSAYAAFLIELDRKFAAGEISAKVMRWAHEIDARLSDAAQC